MIDPNIPVLSAEDIAFLAIAPHKAGPYAVARLLATLAAKDAALADRDREIKHLRESAGLDSCADYVMRNRELESKLRAAEELIADLRALLHSSCRENEFHGRVFERRDVCDSCGMTRAEHERVLNPERGARRYWSRLM